MLLRATTYTKDDGGVGYYLSPVTLVTGDKLIIQKLATKDIELFDNYSVENALVQNYNANTDYSGHKGAKVNAELKALVPEYNTLLASITKTSWTDTTATHCVIDSLSTAREYIGIKYHNQAQLTAPWTEWSNGIKVLTNLSGAYSLKVYKGSSSTAIQTITVSDSITPIYNLIPQTSYTYKVFNSSGTQLATGSFTTTGQIRMLKIPGLRNVRDLGGWKTEDGTKRMKYGMLFRGSQAHGPNDCEVKAGTSTANAALSSTSQSIVKDYLGIKHLIDVTNDSAKPSLYSGITRVMPTSSMNAYNYTIGAYAVPYIKFAKMTGTNSTRINSWKYMIECLVGILNAGRLNEAAYFHCQDGHDRTATLAMIIEGLCGVCEDAIVKDFELSSFAVTSKYCDSGTRIIYYGGSWVVADDEFAITTFSELLTYYTTGSVLTAKTTSVSASALPVCILNWFTEWYSYSTSFIKIYKTSAGVYTTTSTDNTALTAALVISALQSYYLETV